MIIIMKVIMLVIHMVWVWCRYALRDGVTFSPTALGESLVTGFALMEMDNMWRPDLRRVMEHSMVQVSRGLMDKDLFVRTAIEVQTGSRVKRSGLRAKD
jgi:DNA topoisomerase IA